MGHRGALTLSDLATRSDWNFHRAVFLYYLSGRGKRATSNTGNPSPSLLPVSPHVSWADPSQDTQCDRLAIRRSTGTDGTAPALGTLWELFQTKIGTALGQV
jgi:hypothetical protein